MPTSQTSSAPSSWPFRLLVVVIALALWFGTQWLIGQRQLEGEGIVDIPHGWTASIHEYLQSHAAAADSLLIVSSAVIDGLGIFLLAWSVFGRSVRPLVGLLLLFSMRQICQGLCALPAPPGMIWPDGVVRLAPRLPDFLGGWQVPSLLVTYKVANDFFFSGHTALAVYGAVELARLGRRPLVVLAWVIALFQVFVVIILRAHWTMDVVAGALAALLAAGLAAQIAPWCDRWIARLSGRLASG